MKTKSLFAGLLTAGLVLALTAALPAAAAAQQGGVSGKVVDEAGKPVADAVVVISNPSGNGGATLKTNAKGEYQAIGIQPVDFQIKATKGNLTGMVPRIKIGMGAPTLIPTITIVKAAPSALGAGAENLEAKKQAELELAAKAADTAAKAGNLDEAIALYGKVVAEIPKCDVCWLQIGDLNLKKKDEAAAEAAYKKAIDADATKPEAYSALAAMYNGQKKFDDANKMSAKATELMGASGNTDPIAVLNQGIIFWNQSKIPEAKAQFQKVTELDPKNADGHYYLGMCLVNEGKMPDAGKEFQQYITLAPTGQYADTVKSILATIK
jgi:Flp pilus assembly protein TadD